MFARNCLSLWASAFLLAAGSVLPAQQSSAASQAHQQGGSSQNSEAPNDYGSAPAIGDRERSALTFASYDLSVHLRPEDAGVSVLARVRVRNDGADPLPQIAIQISSSLHWDGASQRLDGRTDKLALNQHLLQTDADHTGQASEAVLRLAEPLAPHALTELVLLYSGSIRKSTARLERMGAPVASAAASDWDHVGPEGTALRGFGDVLWYPTISPQAFLGEGATLPHLAGQQMLRQAGASVKLRVSVEYTEGAPGTVFFCGGRQPLKPTSDILDAPISGAPGIATAEFPAQTLGFRTLSLFVTGMPLFTEGGRIDVVSKDWSAMERLSSLSVPIEALLSDWTGQEVIHTLSVIDHQGVAFDDGDLLVAQVTDADGLALRSTLVPALTHTRFRSAHAWLDQGMAQFVSLLWLERNQGRPAAVSALEEASHPLALAESESGSDKKSTESLLLASDAVFYRGKSAAVLWMLRDIVGDDVLKHALQRYDSDPQWDRGGEGFERLLEEVSGKRLHWFFDDWVYSDPGLPDLSILSAAARELPSKTVQGAGWLVAVEVRNDGGAVADVPVTVRSGTLTATERLRINAHSVASTRVLFQGVPEQVQVNDGSVPELVTSTHFRELTAH